MRLRASVLKGTLTALDPGLLIPAIAEVKRRLNVAFLGPMRNPDMMALCGRSLRGGLLLYGLRLRQDIHRARRGGRTRRALPVRRPDRIFETARRQSPCVLFFDEIDVLSRKRSLMRESRRKRRKSCTRWLGRTCA